MIFISSWLISSFLSFQVIFYAINVPQLFLPLLLWLHRSITYHYGRLQKEIDFGFCHNLFKLNKSNTNNNRNLNAVQTIGDNYPLPFFKALKTIVLFLIHFLLFNSCKLEFTHSFFHPEIWFLLATFTIIFHCLFLLLHSTWCILLVFQGFSSQYPNDYKGPLPTISMT